MGTELCDDLLGVIGCCTCMGIYCVKQVLSAELPKLARAITPKNEFNTIYSYSSAITFLSRTLVLLSITARNLTSFS